MRGCQLIGLFLASATVIAPASRGEAPAAGPTFEIVTTAGPASPGRLAAIGVERIEAAPESGEPKAFATTELVRVSRRVEAPAADGALVVLADGDRIARATIGAATDAAIDVQSTATGKASVPLDAALGLVLSPPTDPEGLDAIVRRIRTEPHAGEVAWLANGDRVVGTFEGMDERVVRLQVEGAPRELPREGVTAIGFDPALVSYPRPEGPFLEVGLADGTRLGLVDARLEQGRVSGVSRFGARVDAPLDDVASIVPRTAAVAYLSERQVDAKSYTPYFDVVRPFEVDAAVDGRRGAWGGRRHERGFGTSSRTLLAFKLQPGDLRFQATVGVDERAGPLGNVVFRVLTDGQERFATPAMTTRDAPRDVDVDLAGAKLLILATEFGERGDVRDLADWAEARIIRRP
jgi:hypothetical protein